MEFVFPALVAFGVTSIIAIILFIVLCIGKYGCKCYCCDERRRRNHLLSNCKKGHFNRSGKGTICSNETCPVCLDDFGHRDSIVITFCKHGFHEDCLVQCLRNSADCPLCKVKVLKSSPTPSPRSPLLHSRL